MYVLQRAVKTVAIVVLLVLLQACTLGANHFSSSRLEYNKALQVTEQEELLLNIVRLRYNEPPSFLKVSGISSQFEVSSSLQLAAETDGDARLQLLQPEAAISFSSRPTVSFLPQQDKAFMQQLMRPVGPESLYRLVEYGWGLDRVFSLLVRQANGVGPSLGGGREGATAATSELPALFTVLQDWLPELQLQLQQRDIPYHPPVRVDGTSLDKVMSLEAAGFGLQQQGSGYLLTRSEPSLELVASATLVDSPEWQQFTQQLQLQPDAQTYFVDTGNSAKPRPDQLILAMRSPLSLMAYLSSGVNAPQKQVEQGAVAAASTGLEPFFQVHSQRRKPDDAYLAVEHRGYWFYLRANDLNSRRTLGLLSTLIRQEVQAGGAENLPVLTLPVGR